MDAVKLYSKNKKNKYSIFLSFLFRFEFLNVYLKRPDWNKIKSNKIRVILQFRTETVSKLTGFGKIGDDRLDKWISPSSILAKTYWPCFASFPSASV